MKQFTCCIPMACDNFPSNEVSVKLTGTFYPFHAGYREKSGGQLEPDEPAHFEIDSIFIEDFQKELTPEEAAVIFDRDEIQLMEYFEEQMLYLLENQDSCCF